MNTYFNRIVAAGFIGLLMAGCKDDKTPQPAGAYTDGVVIINGGNFLQNNGTLSFLKSGDTQPALNIYNLVNGSVSLPPVDGRVEGYTEAGDKGIILFDNSTDGMDKVVIVSAATFEKAGEIGAPEIENPRDAVAVSASKVYISNWDALNPDYSYKDGFLTVIDPGTGSVLKRIPVGKGPENLVLHGKKLFVGRNPWTDNELTVINTDSDQKEGGVAFSSSPNPVGIDANGKLWVSEANNLHRVNTATLAIELSIAAGSDPSKSIGAVAFDADGKNIHFVLKYYDAQWNEHGSTYRMSVEATSVDVTKPFADRLFTALKTDPVSKLLYAGVTPSTVQEGYALRITSGGAVQDSVKVEISPEGFYFK